MSVVLHSFSVLLPKPQNPILLELTCIAINEKLK